MQKATSELDDILFNSQDLPPQKSPIPSKFPNPSNKTGEDLQELIEEIPYPTEDLSLTSFSNSSSNTNALKRNKQPIESQKAFFTSFGSEQNVANKSPINMRFERYECQQQKEDSFDDEENDLSNLPNFESLTPHRINQIMDWSKQHVTPGNSKNIFPQVIAPSIEFSHETSAYLSKCAMADQQEGFNNNEPLIENLRENFKPNKKPLGVRNEKSFIIENNGNMNQRPYNLLMQFEEKSQKNEEKKRKIEERDSNSQSCNENDKSQGSQKIEDLILEKSQRLDERSQNYIQKSNLNLNKSNNCHSPKINQNSQAFDEMSQSLSDENPPKFFEESEKPPHQSRQPSPSNYYESQQRIELDRLRFYCENLESQIQTKEHLSHKKDQESITLIARIKELEEEIELVRESTHENSNIELLRGKNLENSRKEAKNLRKELDQKQGFINQLMSQIETLKQEEFGFQESVEKELCFLNGEVEKHKALSIGYKRKAMEVENHLKQVLDQKEIESTDFERKLEAISQGYEEISIENENMKQEKHFFLKDIDTLKKKIKEYEEKISMLQEQNTILKQKEELIYEGKTEEIINERPMLEINLHEEIERIKKLYDKTLKEFEEYKENHHQEFDNTRISLNKVILTEASFGRNESKGILLGTCDHKNLLEGFFFNVGYKEDGIDSLEGKSFEELISLLHNIFNHLQEQFEILYNERNELADNMAKYLDKSEKGINSDEKAQNYDFEREKEVLLDEINANRDEIKANKEEIKRIQDILSQKMNEILLLKEQILRQKEEILKKNESLELFEVRQKVENPEIRVRNSESFQIISQKYEENLQKYEELNKKYNELNQKNLQNEEISQKYYQNIQINEDLIKNKKQSSQKYEELSQKYQQLTQTYEELNKNYNQLTTKSTDTSNRLSTKITDLTEENNQKSIEIQNLLKEKSNFIETITTLKNEKKNDSEIIKNQKIFSLSQKSDIESQKKTIADLLDETSLLKSEINSLHNEINNEKNVSERHREEAIDYSKRLENLTSENEDLKGLLDQQGEKIEELTKLIDEDLQSKAKLDDLQNETTEFMEKLNDFNQENEFLKKEIGLKNNKIEEIRMINERLSNENDLLNADNEHLRQEISIKNEKLRTNEENADSLKEKDKKNIQLFKENKTIQENLKFLEETNMRDKQDLERKNRTLNQKVQDIKNLTQMVKEKNEELIDEKRKNDNIKLQLEETLKNLNDRKINKDKENMIKISNKVKQNDEELKEIKRLFMSEKEKLIRHIREIEVLKEKTQQENIFLKESIQISKEKTILLEKKLNEKIENKKNEKTSQNFWCPEMLSNDETIEMMLELLRRIIGSTIIIGVLNEHEEIIILLKKLMKNLKGGFSLENSKILTRKMF